MTPAEISCAIYQVDQQKKEGSEQEARAEYVKRERMRPDELLIYLLGQE